MFSMYHCGRKLDLRHERSPNFLACGFRMGRPLPSHRRPHEKNRGTVLTQEHDELRWLSNGTSRSSRRKGGAKAVSWAHLEGWMTDKSPDRPKSGRSLFVSFGSECFGGAAAAARRKSPDLSLAQRLQPVDEAGRRLPANDRISPSSVTRTTSEAGMRPRTSRECRRAPRQRRAG